MYFDLLKLLFTIKHFKYINHSFINTYLIYEHVFTVTGATDCGLLEGVLRGESESGLFPPHCVQEVRLRQSLVPPPPLPIHRHSRVIGRRESNATSVKHFATAPRSKKQ